MAYHPHKIFSYAVGDVLFFGPRSGYMASVAQLCTFLTLCSPADLAYVEKVAINDAIFWVQGAHNPVTSKRLTNELMKDLCLRMPKLQYIFILIRDYNPIYRSDIMPVPSPEPHHELETRIGASIATFSYQFRDRRQPEWQISVPSTRSEKCE